MGVALERLAAGQWRQLYQQLLDPCLLIDNQGVILDANPVAMELLRLKGREFGEKELGDILYLSDPSPVRDLVQRVNVSKEVFATKLKADRLGLQLDAQLYPQISDPGESDLHILILYDLTERATEQRFLVNLEAQDRALLEAMGDFYFQLDGEGRCLSYHSVGTSEFCVPPQLFQGELLSQSLPASLAEPAMEALRRALTSQKLQIFATEVEHDGRTCHVEARLVAYGANQAIMVLHDNTTYRQAYEALRISDERFSKFFHSSPDAITVTKFETGLLVEVNQTFERFFGHTSTEAVGKTTLELGLWPDEKDRMEIINLLVKDKCVRDRPIRIRRKDGTLGLYSLNMELMDIEGDVYILSTVHDITLEEQTRRALDASESMLQLTFDSVAEGITLTDMAGNIIQTNRANARLHGFEAPADLQGRIAYEFIAEFDRQRAREMARELLLTGQYEPAEFMLLRADGSSFPGELNLSLSRNEAGETVGFVALTRDISQRKQMEEELRTTQLHYKDFIETSTESVSYWRVPEGLRLDLPLEQKLELIYQSICLDANRVAWESFGLANREELIGKSYDKLVMDRTSEGVFRKFFRNDCMLEDYEYQEPLSTGASYIGLETWRGAVENSELTHLWTMSKDISHQKRAEAALRESEARYRTLFENASDGLFIMKGDQFTDCNQRTLEIFDCDRGQIIGKTPYDFSPINQPGGKASKQLALEKIKAASAGRPQLFEWKHTRQDGSSFDAEISLNQLELATGTHVQAIVRDITDRKLAEKAIIESEELHRTILQGALDGYWLLDLQGNLLEVNNAYCRMSGYSKEELLDLAISDLEAIESAAEIAVRIHKIIDEGQDLFETRHRRRDGTTFDLEISVTPLEGHDGRVVAFLRDITQRKQIEDQITRSEERYRSMVEHTSDAVFCYEFDPPIPADLPFEDQIDRLYEGVLVESNQMAARIFGYDHPEEINGRSVAQLMNIQPGGPNDALFTNFIRNGYRSVDELGVEPLPDGSQRFFSNSAHGVVEEGQLLRVWGTYRDITEKVVAEKQLREKDENIRAIVESSQEWIWAIDVWGKHIFSNPALEMILGYPPQEMFGRSSYDFLHPEDIDLVRTQMPQWLENKVGWSGLILRWRHKDGSYRWLESNAVPILDEKGDLVGFRGVDRDITARREAEQHLTNIFNMTSDFICILDLDSRIFKQVNPALPVFLGFTEEELTTKPFSSFMHPRYAEKIARLINEAISSGNHQFLTEDRYICKNGSQKWIAFNVNVNLSEGMAFGMGRDITEHKEAERELRRRLMKYRFDEGQVYLIKEPTPELSLNAFKDLLKANYDGAVLSRTPESDFVKKVPEDLRYFWLSEMGETGTISPDLEILHKHIMDLPHHVGLYVDRLDYLIFKNGFEKSLDFIQKLRDMVYLKDSIIILSLDPGTITKQQVRMLEKECAELEALHKTTLSEESFALLKLVYENEASKVTTSYQTLVENLGVSRPTARKRVGKLIYMGYLHEVKAGKAKVFELTSKAQTLFSS